MKIYFIRHGKDDENFRGGWSNLGLVPEGVEQAKQLARYLVEKKEEYSITRIVSSDLLRAKGTAEILVEALNLPLQTDERLREARGFRNYIGTRHAMFANSTAKVF